MAKEKIIESEKKEFSHFRALDNIMSAALDPENKYKMYSIIDGLLEKELLFDKSKEDLNSGLYKDTFLSIRQTYLIAELLQKFQKINETLTLKTFSK